MTLAPFGGPVVAVGDLTDATDPVVAPAVAPAAYRDIRAGALVFDEPVDLAGEDPHRLMTTLLDHADILGEGWSLAPLETRASPAGTHERYRFVADDLTLFGHIAQLHLDAEGHAWFAQHSLDARLPDVQEAPAAAVSADDALRSAVDATGTTLLSVDDHDAVLGWSLDEKDLDTVWRVDLVGHDPAVRDPAEHGHDRYEHRVVVDAVDASIHRIEDRLVHAVDGTGMVFATNPIVAAKDYGLLDTPGGVDAPYLNALRVPVTLRDLSEAAGERGRLIGPHAHVLDSVSEPDLDFSYTRMMPGFQDVMAYHHTDLIQRVVQPLGFDDVNNESQDIRNVLAPGLPNAYYSPWADEITLLNHAGPLANADAGEDGEVIVHENGHAVHFDMVPDWHGNYDQGSMGEGFSDYLAAAVLSDHSDGFGDDCAGEWLASHVPVLIYDVPGRPCVRFLDNDHTYGQMGGAPIHEAGQIWSGLLWDVWHEYSRDLSLELVLTSHYFMDGTMDMRDAADMLIVADKVLYDHAHSAFIAQEARDREIDGAWAAFILDDAPEPTMPGEEDDVDEPPAKSTWSYYLTESVAPQTVDTSGWRQVTLGDDATRSYTIAETPFFDMNTTSISVSSNGFVDMEDGYGNGCCSGRPIPADDYVNGMVAGVWTDLDPSACGDISIDITDDLVRVAFEDVPFYGQSCTGSGLPIGEPAAPDSVDFWISIEPATGTIEVHLLRVDDNGARATTGIESPLGDVGNETRHTQDALEEPVAWRFTRVHVDVPPPADDDDDDEDPPLPHPTFESVSPDVVHPGHQVTLMEPTHGGAIETVLVDGEAVPFVFAQFQDCPWSWCDRYTTAVFDAPERTTGAYDVRVENAEGNGTTVAGALRIVERADIAITDLELIDPHILAGDLKVPTEMWTVRITVTNVGATPTVSLHSGHDLIQAELHVVGQDGDILSPTFEGRTLHELAFGSLGPGESTTLDIRWDTRTRTFGDYTLTAQVDAAAEDAAPADNIATTTAWVFIEGHGGI